jgi:hypothetical protein
MTLTEAKKEIARLKKGIRENDFCMVVDGSDMADHGWTTHKRLNERLQELRNELSNKPE